jgi:hypothetical protein
VCGVAHVMQCSDVYTPTTGRSRKVHCSLQSIANFFSFFRVALQTWLTAWLQDFNVGSTLDAIRISFETLSRDLKNSTLQSVRSKVLALAWEPRCPHGALLAASLCSSVMSFDVWSRDDPSNLSLETSRTTSGSAQYWEQGVGTSVWWR